MKVESSVIMMDDDGTTVSELFHFDDGTCHVVVAEIGCSANHWICDLTEEQMEAVSDYGNAVGL